MPPRFSAEAPCRILLKAASRAWSSCSRSEIAAGAMLRWWIEKGEVGVFLVRMERQLNGQQ